MIRIGFSEDIHQKKEGRSLFLGGVEFPNEVGLEGHSDADVVLHAVAESILGALALGDLGDYFPDNDPKYKNISSMILVNHVVALMKDRGYRVSNIDIQVCLKSPKLAFYKKEMKSNIAKALFVEESQVSVKACSYNGVGPIGKGEAIKASSYVLLEK